MSWVYDNVTVNEVLSGDSLDCWIDLGFNLWVQNRLYLFGYVAPEVRGSEIHMGTAAQCRLKEICDLAESIRLVAYKGTSFGLWFCDLKLRFPGSDDYVDAASSLITEGWGVSWDGRGPRPHFDPQAAYPLETK